MTDSVEPEAATATATWPGLMIELVQATSAAGGGCHIGVEEIETLVAVWKHIGVEVHVVKDGGERVAYVEVPGGLSLMFGTRLPAGYQPPSRPGRKSPRRRAS